MNFRTSYPHGISGALVALGLAAAGWQNTAAQPNSASGQEGPKTTQTLEDAFRNPPADTRPGCYWYWMNDNISTAGLTRDLEAMARVGIGRAYIGHIFDRQKESDTPVGNAPFKREAWWTGVQWAVKEAGRCGIEIGFFNAPGWPQSGGPWITPSQSMRYLGHSEVEIVGGKAVDTVLPVPPIDTYPNAGGSAATRTGPNFTAADFQDVRVVAFRQSTDAVRTSCTVISFSGHGGTSATLALSDGLEETFVGFPANQETTLTLRLSRDAGSSSGVQAIILKPLDHSYTLIADVEESEDGQSFRPVTRYREERGHQGPKKEAEIAVPLPQVRGEYLRLKLLFQGAQGKNIRIAELALSGETLLGGYVRKQLGETSPHTQIPPDAYTWETQAAPPGAPVIRSEEVIDLTDKMRAGGKLSWDAPPGKWRVLRMGMIPIGTQSAPCSSESRGLEIDKMNREHAASIFEGMVGEFLRRTPASERTALKYVIADSYETGPQNWTDGLAEKFEKRFGYSPVRFLPVITGRVVDSPEVSDRFLWDFRRLLVELVATEYVGGLREIANKNGLLLWLENYGHWGFPSEFLLYGSQTDEVGGEIWESSDPMGNVECRSASSGAHIYGHNSVYAEVFTSGRTFKQSPATLKRWCDWTFGSGINHMILHVSIHQAGEIKPGIIAWFGTAFNRHNTWFKQGKAFIDYMRRGAVLLKAGRPVADVAYYIGENAPSMQGTRDPELPQGYDYDYINSDVLIHRARAENGRIILPDGVSYSVLVLPKQKRMRPEVAEAVKELVAAGGIVVGPRPEKSPSLQGYPAADARVRTVADEVWGDVDGTRVKGRPYGRGWIHDGVTLSEVFGKHGVTPDVDMVSSPTLLCTVAGGGKLGVNETGGILFKHRSGDGREIYFVSNTSAADAVLTASFRQTGRQPFLWNGVTGEVQPARAFTQRGGRTEVPLRLEGSESVYVVFGDSPGSETASRTVAGAATSNTPEFNTVAELDNRWTVRFESIDPVRETVFEQLSDWSKHSDPNIRYFSGTATYEQTFRLAEAPKERVILDLGRVGVIATVLVNDKEVGTVWTNPWSIDISKYVRQGENNLKVRVTNTWNNRLVGDAEVKLGERRTYISQTYDYDKANPLLSSGLLGPVMVKEERGQ